MSDDASHTTPRREFIATSARFAGGAWLATQLPLLAALSACARDAARNSEPFSILNDAEARTLSAFAAQIFPTDDVPGATEAGSVYFIDRAIGTHFSGMQGLVQGGAAELDTASAAHGATSFADLTGDQQIAVMRTQEQRPFFGATRMLVLMGIFADASYGGNRNNAAATILGIEHKPAYQPPFGYYDAEVQQQPPARGPA